MRVRTRVRSVLEYCRLQSTQHPWYVRTPVQYCNTLDANQEVVIR